MKKIIILAALALSAAAPVAEVTPVHLAAIGDDSTCKVGCWAQNTAVQSVKIAAVGDDTTCKFGCWG